MKRSRGARRLVFPHGFAQKLWVAGGFHRGRLPARTVDENERNRKQQFTSEATTAGVRVEVRSRYSHRQSQPEHKRWFFIYTVTITNESDRSVQLLARHWIVENANGEMDEIRGDGVVGEQPVLAPGEPFEYSSGCHLSTPFGSMRGTYTMLVEDGSTFEADIAPFTLSEPYTVH